MDWIHPQHCKSEEVQGAPAKYDSGLFFSKSVGRMVDSKLSFQIKKKQLINNLIIGLHMLKASITPNFFLKPRVTVKWIVSHFF